ncbi:type II secretion system F family protein, partial [bacterium]|nr:type II secretion system F family protein [bacterium]
PLFGSLYLKLAVARFARTLSTLLAGGLSLFQALDIVKNIMNNSFLTGLIDEVRTSVGEGGSLTAFLREKGIFPAVFLHMTAVGEETGELEQMMTRVADTFEAEVDQTVTTLTSLLEPVMILAMGLVVGIIVIAIMLPIFEMSQVIR